VRERARKHDKERGGEVHSNRVNEKVGKRREGKIEKEREGGRNISTFNK